MASSAPAQRLGSQRRRPGRAGAAAALPVALLLVLAAAPAAAVKGISPYESGVLTFYGGQPDGMDPSSPSYGTKEGSCGYGLIPKEQYPYFSTAALSPQNHFFQADELHGCGQCFQIQCADTRSGVCKTDSAGKPLSVIAMISDSCPECEANHIDLQAQAFAKIADPAVGNIQMQYRRVECAPPEDLKVSVLDFKGAGAWLRLNIDDTGGYAGVSSVQVKGSDGAWKEMQNSWGATWEMSSAPSAPMSFQITSDGGETVTASDVIKQSGGVGAGVEGPRAQFPTAKQFSITDTAYGLVQAMDGPSDPMLVTSSTPGAGDAPGAPPAAGGSGSPVPGSGSPSPAASGGGSGGCVDQPTPDGHSCQQQKDWGKCEASFIKDNAYCQLTCGHCSGSSASGASPASPSPASASPSPASPSTYSSPSPSPGSPSSATPSPSPSAKSSPSPSPPAKSSKPSPPPSPTPSPSSSSSGGKGKGGSRRMLRLH